MNARSRGEADTQLCFFQSQADPAKTRLDATAVVRSTRTELQVCMAWV